MPPAVEPILDESAREFYRDAMGLLRNSSIEFLVGGAYAFAVYTGIERHTKDFDVFLRRGDVERALSAFSTAGYRCELLFPHWLGKVYRGEEFVDLIHGGGNGIAIVDELWFEHAVEGEVLGLPVRLIPAEEMIWSKAYVMERERFDGADVAHILRARASELDWQRMLRRFELHPRLLLAHVVLFSFVYPDRLGTIPEHVVEMLVASLREIEDEPLSDNPVCNGTLLSRGQYLVDIGRWGYRDGRLVPPGVMTAEDVAYWTSMIGEK